MVTHLALTLPAQLEALEQLAPFMESVTQPAPWHLRKQLALAVHELCINIVQHGYAGVHGNIMLHAGCYQHGLFLTVYDTAPNPYRDTKRHAPEPLDLPESGWGLVILHRVMDDVCYARHPKGNAWHLIKFWNGKE